MTIDPITLEILRSRLDETAATMEQLLFHSGYSPILRESRDGSTCILDDQGRPVVAPSSPMQLYPYYHTLQAILAQYGDDMSPGDSFLINDPYVAGNFHVPDMVLITPVFYQGRRIAFCASISHKSDVGGLVPGSCGAASREIFHEGILIPGVRYWTEKGVNPDVEAILRRNSRAPEELLGDLRAQVGCTRVGLRRLVDLCDEYGLETVTESFELLIQRAERLLKLELRRWPDGEHEAVGLLNNVLDGDRPIRFHVRVCKQGDEIEVDYSGSDPQAAGAVNIRRQSSEMAGLLALLAFLDPSIPFNDGPRRAIRFVNPLGRVTNVQHPGPVNNYFPTMHMVYACVMQALSKFEPERALAASGFQHGGHAIGFASSHSGGRAVQFELLCPSLGGSPAADGEFAVLPMSHFTPSQPIEILETEYPVQVTRFEPLVDSAGAGKHRGGPGYVREYRTLAEALYTLRLGGFAQSPSAEGWGVAGGTGPAVPSFVLNPGTAREERLPAFVTREVHPGDIIQLRMSGGWGWGNPLDRDPKAVAADVRNGLVSATAAQEVYGVVFDDTGRTVDLRATTARRQNRPWLDKWQA